MKKFIKIFFSIILLIIVLSLAFCLIDTLRVRSDEEPIFTFKHKIIDGLDYSAKVDSGLGYKIIRFDYQNQAEELRIGGFWISEAPKYTSEQSSSDEADMVNEVSHETSGEISGELSGEPSGETLESGDASGEKEYKRATFGEKYLDKIYLEGQEEEVYAQPLNSKVGYSIDYYFELFEYFGFDDYDKFEWKASSGDTGSIMTVYNISDEEAYKESLENITKDGLFSEESGDESGKIQKIYNRNFKENDIEKVNRIYIMELDDLKLMVDLYLPIEAQEGVGVYMENMVSKIRKS